MKTQWFILAIAALVVLSACAPTDSTTTDDGTPAQDGPASDEAAAPAQDGPEGNDAKDAFLKYLGDKVRLEWKIAYDTTMTLEGETTTTQMAMYLKGENMRTDATVPQYGEARTYIVDDVFTTCYQQSGEWQCMQISAAEGDDTTTSQRDFEESIQEEEADYDIAFDGTKQVAGVTATCFKVTSVENVETLRYCFSKEGAPLYVLIEGSADDASFKSEMIATSYSTRVADSDFVPPAEATEFGAGGTMPAGSGAGGACAYCDYLSGSDKDECLASC